MRDRAKTDSPDQIAPELLEGNLEQLRRAEKGLRCALEQVVM